MSPVIVLVLAFFVVVGLLMWLWNLTLPDLFSLPRITYWQAFRLVLMAGILFGALHSAAGGQGVSLSL